VGDNIGIDLKGIGWKGVDRIYLSRNRDKRLAALTTIMKHRVPYTEANFVTCGGNVTF
jgi:hypothetical protein